MLLYYLQISVYHLAFMQIAHSIDDLIEDVKDLLLTQRPLELREVSVRTELHDDVNVFFILEVV